MTGGDGLVTSSSGSLGAKAASRLSTRLEKKRAVIGVISSVYLRGR